MAKPIFKAYQQNQTYLFPPKLEDLIASHHPVRVVSEVIDRIDIDIIIKKYKGGFVKTYAFYQAKGCNNCPLKEACHKQKGNRIIRVNHKGRWLKQQAEQRLKTEKGLYYRKKRPADVEPVFGNIKYNKNFKRFLLKGITKTEIEWGLVCIVHNLKKMAA